MKLPNNAAAMEIVRLRGINNDIDEQMRVLREHQMNNSELIGNFSHVAEWIDDSPAPEPPIEETPEPELEPPVEEIPDPEPEPESDPDPEVIPEEASEIPEAEVV